MDQIFAYGGSYLAAQFEDYLKTKKAETPELSAFFDGYLLGASDTSMPQLELEAMRLLQLYRHFGYKIANTNPLSSPPQLKELDCKINPDALVPSFGLFNEPSIEASRFFETLKSLYASSIGYEFLHCDKSVIQFITDYIEKQKFSSNYLSDLETYTLMARAEFFETFLHTRFPGQKRFSLEGLETSIILIEEMLEHAHKLNYQTAYFGMAHRGRLNLLANVFQKPLSTIFQEFSGLKQPQDPSFLGDVKYHQGASCTKKNGMKLTLSANPSHLEAVDPVVLGMSFASQKITNEKALTLLIHGDASFAGQGVVYETMQMAKLKDYDPGGVIHIIQNNQIGFTALPKESRSTSYPTDLAKTFNCPIFHVNAEDVTGVKKVAELALQLVSNFKIDVMIDLIGYRRWGHNESDEPSFTQPLLYQAIRERKNPLVLFRQKILQTNPELASQLDSIESTILTELQQSFQNKDAQLEKAPFLQPTDHLQVDQQIIEEVAKSITKIPSSFSAHPKLNKLFEERRVSVFEKKEIDFPLAELLAFGVILKRNKSLRLVGQDSARGTFSQRHAVIVDQNTEERFQIFESLVHQDLFCEIVNSFLSEFAALGFEYGFSKIAHSKSLTLWEAQFGDFANSAQVIIDQFIASGKSKWNELSNLTLLLPHGYEGQGPEHTSARLERFLELAAQNNMIIAVPSTPGQYFQLLLNQVTNICPLIAFTPKALLRHPQCKSPLSHFYQNSFSPILDDGNEKATVAVLCFGKIYYDLKESIEKRSITHVSLIRLEQLYPFEKDLLLGYLKKKQALKRVVLVQDEPKNMGAYMFLKAHLDQLELISRPEASSPATGFPSVHKMQYDEILRKFESL